MAVIASHVEGQVSMVLGTPATALTAGVSSGATSLPITAGTGTNFAAGQLILIDSGASAEVVKVKSTAANTLTVTDGGCVNAHTSGAAVALATVSGPGTDPVSPYLAGG